MVEFLKAKMSENLNYIIILISEAALQPEVFLRKGEHLFLRAPLTSGGLLLQFVGNPFMTIIQWDYYYHSEINNILVF